MQLQDAAIGLSWRTSGEQQKSSESRSSSNTQSSFWTFTGVDESTSFDRLIVSQSICLELMQILS